MKTMAEVDAWYEAEMDKARLKGELKGELKGKIELASNIIRVKFGDEITLQIVSQLQKLNTKQLDDFTLAMLNWQQPSEMSEWLTRLEKV